MLVQGIFNCILCDDSIDTVDNTELSNYSYSLMNNKNSRIISNRGGWQSDFVDQEPEMQTLVTEVNNKLESLRSVLNFEDDYELKVESMWININTPHSYNEMHIHPHSYLSGCYYVKVPENSGEIFFKHPAYNYMFYPYKKYFKSNDGISSNKLNIQPTENKFLLFSSWVEHGVEQNLSKEDRISVAFNTVFYER